ncbi:hypothetical protein E2C01_065104 [Portunus trituberculatus]|uniref:Uncharacterized protein n=1 Tax=Portunus trituberculatus TaxID=210409 RepID=A0A5B7HKZ8_PORTR|nr:hypothetical protein [Portunus trituberculatus]
MPDKGNPYLRIHGPGHKTTVKSEFPQFTLPRFPQVPVIERSEQAGLCDNCSWSDTNQRPPAIPTQK